MWNGIRDRLAVRGKPCKQHGGRSGRCGRRVNLTAKRKLSVETLEDRMLLAGDTLVITELMAINGRTLADEDGDFEDWVEIYNPTDAAVDLDGWFLTDDSDRLNRWRLPAVTMEPGDYEVVFASKKDQTGAELHTDFKLDGDGEFLALVEPDGTTIASEFRPEFPEQTSDVSFGLASDLETKGYFLLPTPGAPNVGDPIDDPTRQIVISEIMYHPASNDSREEYIELLNLGTNAVDLTGWKIDKGVQFEFPAMSLGAGERLVVAADLLSFQTKYEDVTNVVGGWTGQLSNQSETIAIEDASGKRIDRVEYADGGEWAVRVSSGGWSWSDAHDGGGKSLELVNRLMPNRYGQNWLASLADGGTPGTENSVAASKTAPLILDVTHSPNIPRSTDTVTVSARILVDPSAEPTVKVRYNDFRRGAESFQTIVMHDDGQSGDDVAGDGIYTVEIPPQADGTVVEFYVQAISDPRDRASLRTWPASARNAQDSLRPLANALYQVEDRALSSDLPVYRTIMTPGDRSQFASQRGDTQMNATFISSIGGQIEVRYNAGVRVRGNGSRNNSPPPNRINLPSDKPWNGVTALNLNSVAPENQVAGAALFAFVGLPAAHAMPVQYLSNGANLNFGSFYAHVEPLNSDFVAKHFPDDDGGNLYKGVRPRGGLEYLSNDPNAYSSYQKLSNEAEADWSDIIDLTYQLNRSPNETYLEDIAQVVDIDQWLRFFALNALLGNTEGGLVTGDQSGDDYAMYRGVEDPRFQMVTHDLDSILRDENGGIFRATGVAALDRFLRHPDILPRYYAQFVDLIVNVTTPNNVESVLREALGKAVSKGTIDGMLSYLQSRSDNILAMFPQLPQFPGQFTVEPTQPIVNGYRFSARRTFSLQGKYDPIATESVTVNGIEAELSPQSRQWMFSSDMLTNQETVVSSGAAWRFLDDGTYPGIAWRGLSFDDSSWNLGTAQLGFGDDDETTVINGGPINDRHITTYFRHEFQLDNPAEVRALTVHLLRDDSAVIYLNGEDVVRSNIEFKRIRKGTLALSDVAGDEEAIWHSYEIDVSKLARGRNVLAVEVRQSSPISDDLSFDLSLVATVPDQSVGRLDPGINRVLVEASGLEGKLLASETLEIWYDDGRVASLTGPITDDRVLAAKKGPWHVTEDLIVEEDATLTIEPGTTLYFDENASLIVRGTLIAEGLPMRRIRFTVDPEAALVPDLPGGEPGLPDGPPRWGGIQFRDTMSDLNRIAHADFDFAQALNGSIGAINSQVVVDDVTFFGTHLRMIYAEASSVIVRNSLFPDMFAHGGIPIALGLDNASEHIKSIGQIPDGGRFIIQNNRFGANKGSNAVVDVISRSRPGPIVQILGNVFPGTVGEEISVTGDAHIAGNYFLNGPFARELGELVPGTARITGEPVPITNRADATLTVGGLSVYAYRYRVNGGPLSDPIDIDNNLNQTNEILLTDLPDGSYTVEVFGQGFAGEWQIEPTRSTTWQVDSEAPSPISPQLVISEILALNRTVTHDNRSVGDLIELHNASDQAVDLSGMSITDNNDRPEKYVFPAGTTLAAGEYLVLHADNNFSVGGEIHMGFSLKSSGDDVTLFGSDGKELDYIQFGIQADDLSVARLRSGEWGLATPTFGFANVAQPLGDPHGLKINEWFTAGEYIIDQRVRSDDFVELYNGDSLPVLLGGLFVTDLLDGAPDKHEIVPLSYIGPTDYAVLIADSKPSSGADHLNFRLASDWGWIGLFDQNVEPIDRVLYGEQQPGVSQGRAPDGGEFFEFFTQPTPGIDVSPPSVPTNVEVVTRTSTRVEIHWSASVDEQSGVAGYRVYRDGELVASTAETSYVDTSVLPGELYRYRVSAIDTIGAESEGSDSIRTLFEYSPPTNLQGMAISRSQIDLTWDAPIDPESPVVEYRIYRDGELIGTGESTSFIDTSFTVGPTISYQISYINEEGLETIRSTPLGFTFLQQGTDSYFGASDSWINANFPEVNYNDPNENYKLEIDGTDPEETLSLMRWDVGRIFANQIVEGVSLTVNVTNRSSEEYEIYEANRSWNDDEVTWQQAADRVNWQEPGARGVDDRGGDVLGVMLGPNEGELTTPFTAAGVAAVQDWIANPAVNYGIIISDDDNFNGLVVDSAEGRQPPLLIISHRSVDGSDVTPPPIPTGLRFEQLTPTVAEIAWDRVSDPESVAVGYRVFRDGILIVQTSRTYYTNANLSADKHYLYQVSASNSAGLESRRSETLTTDRDLTPPSIPVGLRTTSLTPTEIGLAWDAAIDLDTGVASYTVFRNGVEIGVSTITSFRDNTVAPGPPSVYTVSATNDHGTVSDVSLPATVIMFQDGVSPNVLYAGTRDTWIDETNPTSTAGGTDTGIELDGGRENLELDKLALLKWDIGSNFFPGARVIDAAIVLTVTERGLGSHEFYGLLKPWNESEASWLMSSDDTPWESPGANGDRSGHFATTGSTLGAEPIVMRTRDSRLHVVQSWIDDPSTNHGVISYAPIDLRDGFSFASRESADASTRPIFIVSVLAPGSDTTPPSFAGQMVARDDGVSQIRLGWGNATDRDTGISHYEIFRDSVLIGTSATQKYIDYVEYGVTYEYRVRAINGDQMPGELSRPTLHKIDHSDTGYGVQLVAPETYIPGIPFLVRVNAVDEEGNINRTVNDSAYIRSYQGYLALTGKTQFRMYDGIGAQWLTIDEPDSDRLNATLEGVSVIKPIVANSKPIREVSGTLAMSETWSDVIRVVGDTIVPDGGQLTIMPGTTILVDGTATPLDENGVDIIVQGSLQALGTAFSPIVITATEPGTYWGEINHDNAEPSLYQFTHIMRGGHSPRDGHTSSGPVIRSDNSQIIIEDSAIIWNAGKIMQANNSDLVFRESILAQSVMGLEIADSALLFERNLTDDFSIAQNGNRDDDSENGENSDAIFVHGQLPGQEIRIIDSLLRNGRGDGIEIIDADVFIENVRIWAFQDKGVSITDGNATIEDTVITTVQTGVSASVQNGETASVVMNGVEFARARIAIQARDEYGNPDAEISFTVSNSILLADDPIRTDYDPADINITYSTIGEIWPGVGNIIDIPEDHFLLRVHRVRIASTEWAPDFNSQFDHGTYLIPDGRDQKKPIPWSNLNQLTIHFTTDVELDATDLKVIGLDGTDYTANLANFSISDRYNFAAWTFSDPLPNDRYELQLSDSVHDRLNFPLDGEWHPREGDYPSGDGQAGGDFIFQFTVLPGDTNQSGRSDLRDIQAVRRALLSSVGDVEYSSMADLDGSGHIDLRDMQVLRNWLLRPLPQAANLASLAATERRRTSSEALFARLATDGDDEGAAWSIKDIDAIVVDNEDWMEAFEDVTK